MLESGSQGEKEISKVIYVDFIKAVVSTIWERNNMWRLSHFLALTMASTFIKRTCPQGTPWTLEVLPASSSCVPNHENNEIRVNIAVEVSGDTDEWAREHEDDFICVESWQEEKVRSRKEGDVFGEREIENSVRC